jgi:hypothetical protein
MNALELLNGRNGHGHDRAATTPPVPAIAEALSNLGKLLAGLDGVRQVAIRVVDGALAGLVVTELTHNGRPAPPAEQAPATHWRYSPDYRKVWWHGHHFRFTVLQAAVVEHLAIAREGGLPEVHQWEILKAVGSECTRLSDLFKRGDAARAWQFLIVQGDAPGTYRLADEPPEQTEAA